MDTVLRLLLGDETAISALSSEPLEGLAVCRGKGSSLFFIYFFFLRTLVLVQPRTGTRDLSLRKIALYLIIAVLHSKTGLLTVIHF